MTNPFVLFKYFLRCCFFQMGLLLYIYKRSCWFRYSLREQNDSSGELRILLWSAVNLSSSLGSLSARADIWEILCLALWKLVVSVLGLPVSKLLPEYCDYLVYHYY